MLPGRLSEWEFAVERDYTRRIARLAQENGTQVVFLYAPVFHFDTPVQDRDFYAAIGPMLEARFLAPDPANFSDYGHANRIGSARLTTWLGKQLQEYGLLDALNQETQ